MGATLGVLAVFWTTAGVLSTHCLGAVVCIVARHHLPPLTLRTC